MDKPTTSRAWPANPAIAGAVAFFVAGAFIAGPRAAPVLLPLLAAIVLVPALAGRRLTAGRGEVSAQRSLLNLDRFSLRTALMGTLLLFGFYLLINATWSAVPVLALGKATFYFLVLASTVIGIAALKTADSALIERMAWGTLLAGAIFTLYLAIEVLFAMPIQRLLFSLLPFLQPASHKHMTITDGWVTFIGPYVLNRSVAAGCLLIWPLMLIAGRYFEPKMGRAGALALFASLVIATVFSRHETSMLALAFSGTVFLVARAWPVAGFRIAAGGWIAATLLVVPIAIAAYAQNLHFADWIPSTGRARIIIWDYTAEQVLKNPLLGVGIESTRPLDIARRKTAEWPKGFAYPRRTGRHSHNIYMQVWYELGAVGAALLSAAGLLLLGRLRRLSGGVRPYALAAFTCAAVTAAFSWGMWQLWFMAAFGLCALIMALAIEMAQDRTWRAP